MNSIVKSNNNVNILYKSGSHATSIEYIKQNFGFQDLIDIDGVVFETDKVVIKDVLNEEAAIKRFIEAVKTLRLFGLQSLGKVPSEVDDICEKLYKIKHREIWEKLAEKGKTTPAILAGELNLDIGLVGDTLYNWVRAKFKISPLARDGKGSYFLTTCGRLVWQRYKQKYNLEEQSVENIGDNSSESKKVETTRNPKVTLNKFFHAVYLNNRRE